MFSYLSSKLPISRLQRDLTDSTVLRNIGTVFGHIVIAFHNIINGLSKIDVNNNKIKEDVENNKIVIAEGIQTILRKVNYPNAYEVVKEFTRKHKNFTTSEFNEFIDTLNCSEEIKKQLKLINIENYIGYSSNLL